MSALGDHLFNQYGGDVPSDPQSVAREAIQRYGSGRAAARAMGIDEKTIRRWKNGETRQSERAERFAKDERRAYADRKQGPVEIKFKYAKRERALKFGDGAKQGLKSGAEQRIAEAYVRGDKEAMAKAFVDGVSDAQYRKMFTRAYEAGLDVSEAGEDSDLPGAFVA
jgi:flagellar biosynthesis/type III secretory pathway protein FliH